jgi:sugar-specific transcriptional regulator TrmB
MEINELLKDFGLTESETKIYLYLLSHGHATPPAIAKSTGISRPNCYSVLQSLEGRSLITDRLQGKRKVYLANDPAALVASLEKKKKTLESALPDLRMMFAKQTNKPNITFYEGVEQFKVLFNEVLSSKDKKVYGVASTKKLFDAVGRDFFRIWGKNMKKNGIKLNDIISHESSMESADFAKSNFSDYYNFKSLPPSAGDLPSDILIWDDCVALMSLDEPLFATLIKNQAVADTMKLLFEQSWKKM